MTPIYTHSDVLRGLADIMDAHPDLPKPSVGWDGEINWFSAHTPADAAKIMRAFPGRTWEKNDPNSGSEYDLSQATFTTTFLGRKAAIRMDRGAVCTRKIIGQRDVTKTIPVTTQEVTVTENIYEWECSSVLAQAGA